MFDDWESLSTLIGDLDKIPLPSDSRFASDASIGHFRRDSSAALRALTLTKPPRFDDCIEENFVALVDSWVDRIFCGEPTAYVSGTCAS